MCGILAILKLDPARANYGALRTQALSMAKKIRHRGPDWSGIYGDEQAIIAHERLSIVDVEHGAQPLIDKLNGNVLAVNGEIYNHKELRQQLQQPHDFQTASDCEVILYLYDEMSPGTSSTDSTASLPSYSTIQNARPFSSPVTPSASIPSMWVGTTRRISMWLQR